MFRRVVIAVFVFTFLFCGNAEAIKEPDLVSAIAWKPHKSLGIILKFQTEEGEIFLFAHPLVGFPIGRKDCNLIQSNKYGAKALTTGNTNVFEYNFSKEASMYKAEKASVWKPYFRKVNR